MSKSNVSKHISALLLFVLLCLLTLSAAQKYWGFNVSNPIKLLIYVIIYFVPILIYTKAHRYKLSAALKLRHVKLRYMPFILLFALSTSIICTLINVGSFFISERVFGISGGGGTEIFFTENPFTLIITMVILPALAEELLMRGIALTEYSKYGIAVSVVMTSILFALFHISLRTLLSLFVAGIFYAVLTHLFRSVYPAIIAHMINNFISLYISRNSDFMDYIKNDTLFTILAAVSICFILFMTLKMLEGVVERLGDKKRLKTNTKKLIYGDPVKSMALWLFIVISVVCIIKNII